MLLEIFKEIFNNFIRDFWYMPLLFLILSLLKLFKPRIKGYFGERTLIHILRKLPRDEYRILNDLLIKTSSGTSQIDHVVISKYGVFVIETKSYKGWIYGSPYAKSWTQNIYGNKYKFQNPLHQNYGHIKRLEELNPNFKKIDFISIIAFSGEADLKEEIDNVTYFSKIPDLIRSYGEVLYLDSDVDRIYDIIRSSNVLSRKERREHVRNIRARFN